jgi:polyhydroxybutyrate depolymerase
MKKIALAAFLLLIFLSMNAQNYSFMYDGIERSYIVHPPPDYDPGEVYPMVINMHGLGSNALEQQFYSGFDFVADTAGIIMAYPNGVDNQWNAFFNFGVDDVGFISALIDTMAANFSVDLNRVYATGMSMGGFMSYRLACELENRITAIASVTGLLAYEPCDPSRPVPVLQMHGTDDPTVPYTGVPLTISYWTDHNLCPPDSTVIDLPDIDPDDQSTVTLTIYSPCDDSSEVLLYTINGGEHTWPGSSIIIGVTNQDINGSVEIWNFFKKFTLDEFTSIPSIPQEHAGLKISPMPVTSSAVIDIPGNGTSSSSLRIYDLSGKLISEEHFGNSGKIVFNRDGLKNGMYLIEVLAGKKVYRSKMLVN